MGIIVIPTSEVSVRIMSCHVGYLIKGPASPGISNQLKLPLTIITIILLGIILGKPKLERNQKTMADNQTSLMLRNVQSKSLMS